MTESSFTWAGTIALVFLAVLLLAVVWPQVDGWYDDWRQFAHESRYGGECSADPQPAQCAEDPPAELWMFVPWLLAVGSTASMLIICYPNSVPLRRGSEPDG